MKNLIFIFVIFYSLLLNAQVDSVSSQKENTVSNTAQNHKVEVVSNMTTLQKKSAEDKTEEDVVEDASLTKEVQKTKRYFGASVLDAIDTSVELGLEYPLSFGVHGKFHINKSVYTRLAFGFTPGFFVGAFTRIAPSLGYLERHEASLIGDVIQNSLFGSIRLGWLPYTKKVGGPYMELGLFGLAFGRGETSGTTLNEAIGTELNTVGDNLYSVKSELLSGTFHMGYQIPIEKHIRLNLELGILKILFANVKEDKKNEVVSLPEKHHEVFRKFLVEKGWIFPTFSAWLGFSF